MGTLVFGSLTGWLGAGLAIVLLLAVVLGPHNWRVYRARRTFRQLPDDVKKHVLEAISRAASARPSVTFLRLSEHPAESVRDLAIKSHVGGSPYTEAGEEWPTCEARPARFLLQIRLCEPSLGPVWQGRLIAVFLVFDEEQVVRSYADPSLHRCVPMQSPEPLFECVMLEPLSMPIEADDERRPMSPARLCETFPEIRLTLRPYSNDVPGLLAQVLHANIYGYDLAEPDIAYVGGDPSLIQNPHDPVCKLCGGAMRFLFQFGEIIPDCQLADGGVCYVYGCDAHPEHCRAYLDSH